MTAFSFFVLFFGATALIKGYPSTKKKHTENFVEVLFDVSSYMHMPLRGHKTLKKSLTSSLESLNWSFPISPMVCGYHVFASSASITGMLLLSSFSMTLWSDATKLG